MESHMQNEQIGITDLSTSHDQIESAHQLSFMRLLQGDYFQDDTDLPRVEGYADINSEFPSANNQHEIPWQGEDSTNIQSNLRLAWEIVESDKENNPNSSSKQPMQRNQSPSKKTRVIDLLRVPMSEVSVRQAPREAFVDYTNSLILTSSQYIASMKAKNAKKDEIAKAREQKKVEKEQRRFESLAELDARRRRQEEAAQAKSSKKNNSLLKLGCELFFGRVVPQKV
ncbi:hypothetical protein GOP47_0010782 [Adiantum capillus-veneris]|uniref:Uncharacterized protein n=1 Tax=Adiantum capillus-veneris TaxID=13818 RepID=A0A9D4UVR6_ADICA|nr:hypothetical protein GOP47_0010782 [Adiantum capillus-veneris]